MNTLLGREVSAQKKRLIKKIMRILGHPNLKLTTAKILGVGHAFWWHASYIHIPFKVICSAWKHVHDDINRLSAWKYMCVFWDIATDQGNPQTLTPWHGRFHYHLGKQNNKGRIDTSLLWLLFQSFLRYLNGDSVSCWGALLVEALPIGQHTSYCTIQITFIG